MKLTNGVIEADGLEISDHGKIIAFTGRVRTVLEPGSPTTTAALPQKIVSSPSENQNQPVAGVSRPPMSLRP